MKRILVIVSLIISVLPLSGYVSTFAAEDQFIIRQVVGTADITAPSTPTNLTATAVSSSQIDLSWDPSTDDVAVTDYRVYRDGLLVGTSGGLTTYSDIGLSPNTTYIYTVSAIDAANNESGQSASEDATTFALPNPDSSDDVGNGATSVRLLYLTVAPDLTNAVIRFGTNVPVLASVYWGKTRDLELGSLSTERYESNHYIRLEDLTPGTRYYFKITLIDGYNKRLVINNQDFYTLSLPDDLGPVNVTNFKAKEVNGRVALTWNNPQADFEKVRIVKSDKFFPRDPYDGIVIYEGRAEEFLDRNVVAGKTYYYSAFAVDESGNYSSGSVTDIRLSLAGETPGKPQLFAGILKLPSELIDPLLRKLSLADIDFIQDGHKKPIISDSVEIRGDRSLTISIDYDKVPEILKTIAVTMYDPNDKEKTFSFLLRVNKDKTAYVANIAAFERPGRYDFALAVLDYKHQGLASLAGTIIARIPDVLIETKNSFVADYMNLLWLLLVVPVLFVIKFYFHDRKRVVLKTTNRDTSLDRKD
ncbi:MAG TPA: fibronectin type III domain-containing protein [Candidatus Nanoarchaeia archaeon]|nr:fibronectin type III domain-containing protein [Candidatus Nanoarchaeia archaeon]